MIYFLIIVKLLWAPIVDSIYFKKFGRRKTWLIPVQFLIGILMFSTANIAQKLIDQGQSKTDILILTIIFLIFNLLAATQGIFIIMLFFNNLNITKLV
jgi:MFS transporter, PAT family, solute carrier family 33 (acetyl-CoA transportor), member 1